MTIPFKRGFSLPDSQVKSPGTLLKKNSLQYQTRQNEIQELLAEFKNLEEESQQSLSDAPVIPSEKPTTFIEKKNSLHWFMKSRSDDEIRGPGRLKSSSEDMSSFIHKAKEILQFFNIELIICNSKNSKEVRSFLQTLIPEICFFPYNFYQSLNIKNIVISKECGNGFYFEKETCFFLNQLETPQKVLQRLHQIIFNHLMVTKGSFMIRWQECRSKQEDVLMHSLEDIFMTLMNNTGDITLKSQAKKLREFLENFYPEAMSEAQFKSKHKKKTLKVSFDVIAN